MCFSYREEKANNFISLAMLVMKLYDGKVLICDQEITVDKRKG
jgi:hypothetical protein